LEYVAGVQLFKYVSSKYEVSRIVCDWFYLCSWWMLELDTAGCRISTRYNESWFQFVFSWISQAPFADIWRDLTKTAVGQKIEMINPFVKGSLPVNWVGTVMYFSGAFLKRVHCSYCLFSLPLWVS
jgi:hypothetical protein